MVNVNTYDRFVRDIPQRNIQRSSCGTIFAPFSKTQFGHGCNNDRRGEKYRASRLAEIDSHPKMVLKAPGIIDDFYLNIMDCNQANTVAIALSNKILLWNIISRRCESLAADTLFPGRGLHSEYISALCFTHTAETIIVGNSAGRIMATNILTNTSQSYTSCNSGRIVSISPTGHGFATGTRSGVIFVYDKRVNKPTQTLSGAHRLEVCGLQASLDERFMASGGNDNLVCIWDVRLPRLPLHRQSDHLAAVKALAWCPWQSHVLATGAGTADKRIRVWDTISNTCVNSLHTDDQICSIHFAMDRSEFVSCHGFLGNSVNIWHYPEMLPITSMHAHDSRILQSCMTIDASSLITAGADEHIKLWNIFPPS